MLHTALSLVITGDTLCWETRPARHTSTLLSQVLSGISVNGQLKKHLLCLGKSVIRQLKHFREIRRALEAFIMFREIRG